jgi:hypothetical protein
MAQNPPPIESLTREDLISMLSAASEIEHQLLCVYLFAAYSLKSDLAEGGMTPDEFNCVSDWQGSIIDVAVQEMLHLSLASNMLTSIGGAPHFSRPSLPQNTMKYYPPNFRLDLLPFSRDTLNGFICFESFEQDQLCTGVSTKDPKCTGDPDALKNLTCPQTAQPPITVGELYLRIAKTFIALSSQIGEAALFIGPPSAQMTDAAVTDLFGYGVLPSTPRAKAARVPQPDFGECNDVKIPLLNPVTDLKSALIAINTIVVQGEGDVVEWQKFRATTGVDFPVITTQSHETTFCQILSQYSQIVKSDPNFSPVRPVLPNPYPANNVPPDADTPVSLIDDPLAAGVATLFNELYDLMMKMLSRSFAHTDETPYEVASLVQTTLRMMVYVLGGLGGTLTQLPATPTPVTGNAGPGFTFDRTIEFLPHKASAWTFFKERLAYLAQCAFDLSQSQEAKNVIVFTYGGKMTVSDYLNTSVVPMLKFYAERLKLVFAAEEAGVQRLETHVCRGLNACQGHDITGRAEMAGMGYCATADPHICAGHNDCRIQGGCGSPNPYFPMTDPRQYDFQNHPNENLCKSYGACGSPILPGTTITVGVNTGTLVWDLARKLFEERMSKVGIEFGPAPPFPGTKK